ncbi:MAG: hypothetical protein AABY15_09235 [Nanoarchaeota archaeon]
MTGHFDLLEAKIESDGEEILSIEGQISHNIIEPIPFVLITNVKHKNGVTPPYTVWDRPFFPKFMENIYRFKLSFDKDIKSLESLGYESKMEINMRTVLQETN